MSWLAAGCLVVMGALLRDLLLLLLQWRIALTLYIEYKKTLGK